MVYCVDLCHKYTSDFRIVLFFVLRITKTALARMFEVIQNLTKNVTDVSMQSLDTQRNGACFSAYVIRQRGATFFLTLLFD